MEITTTSISKDDDSMYFLNKKKKRFFGKKIKISEWDNYNDVDIPSNLEEPNVLDYINSHKNISISELKKLLKVQSTEDEIQGLNEILEINPMMNIRKRENDYLLRIKIKRGKINRQFNNLNTAKEFRNLLLLYAISNDKNFKMHLKKRNKISEANQLKCGNQKKSQDSLDNTNDS